MPLTNLPTRWLIGAALLASFASVSARAQATVTVAAQDPVYRDLDRLFGAGLVKKMIVGMKPYSRREIARIVLEASRSPLGREISPTNRRIIDRLSREYAPELRMLAGDTAFGPRFTLDRAAVEALGTNSPNRAIPPDSVGHVEADVNPLLNNRAGRTYRPGTNVAAELDASWRLSREVVVRVAPRAIVNADGGDAFAEASIEAASMTFVGHNVQFEAGRQQFVWGQGMEGGLLGSTSGRPLDMLRLANDTPYTIPHFAPVRGEVVFIDLGPNQRFPYSNIIAYKLSGNPFFLSRFELSASVLSEQGGYGGPHASLIDHLVDIIPPLKYPLHSKNRDQFSNKIAGMDGRLRIPEWSGLQLYAEAQLDDADPRRWWSTFWQDGGHVDGFSFSHLGAADAWSLGGEFHHTGLRFYEHQPYTSGIAFNRTLIGDPLGPQGNAGYLRLTRDDGGTSAFSLDGAIERRGGNVIGTAVQGVSPHETDFHFVVLETKPMEWRHRVMGTWEYCPVAKWRASVQAGYERVHNFDFVYAANRNNFLASATLELLPW